MARSLTRLGAAMMLALGLHIAACSPSAPTGSAGEAEGVLAFGLLPDENPSVQQINYGPLVDAIRTRTGFGVRLVLPPSYEDLVAAFSAGELDAAYFGGFTFLLAEEQSDALPLVMRDVDANFVSYVLVRKDREMRKISDLANGRFSFGSRYSTSGHLMPRYFLGEQGIEPELFFSGIKYSGTHDRTIQWVSDGTVDAGVVNGQIFERLLKAGDIHANALRIVWQSPRYVDYVWAVQSAMTDRTRRAIKEVFLSLTTESRSDARFLEHVGADYYIPADTRDFDDLREAVSGLKVTQSVTVDPARRK